MKKLCIFVVMGILVLILLLPNSASAYEIKGGLKIGLNMANIHGKDVKEFEQVVGGNWESKLVFCGGGYITLTLTEMIAIQAEVLYTQKGAKYDMTWYDETYSAKFNFSYLEIPVLAKILIPTQSSFKPSLFAGPALALKLSGKAKSEYAGESYEEDVEAMKGTDFGFILGAGIDFGLGGVIKGKITVDVRYNLGLTTISKKVEGESTDIKNGVFSFMIGYSF